MRLVLSGLLSLLICSCQSLTPTTVKTGQSSVTLSEPTASAEARPVQQIVDVVDESTDQSPLITEISTQNEATKAPAIEPTADLANTATVTTEKPSVDEKAPAEKTPKNDLKIGDHQVLGYLEPAAILSGKYQGTAKLDTGADNSSLSALNITAFERDGKDFVRFTLDPRLTNNKEVTIERPILRKTSIKRHGSDPQERYVVMIDLKIGTTDQEVPFSLTDRSEYSVTILVGRNYMNGFILVDPSREMTLER